MILKLSHITLLLTQNIINMYLQQERLIKPEGPTNNHLFHHIITLLKDLISKPSFSGDESYTATLIQCFLQNRWVETHRKLHNVWAFNRFYDPAKPTILLNSHHDTVKPNLQYTRDPFTPSVAGDKLYGLGSNDAGGCLVALLATFLHFYDRPGLPYNLCYAATAEEETSRGKRSQTDFASFCIHIMQRINC